MGREDALIAADHDEGMPHTPEQIRCVAEKFLARREAHRAVRSRTDGSPVPYFGGSPDAERALFQRIAGVVLTHIVSGVCWRYYDFDGGGGSICADTPVVDYSRIEFDVPEHLLDSDFKPLEPHRIANAILRHLDTSGEDAVEAARIAGEIVRKFRKR